MNRKLTAVLTMIVASLLFNATAAAQDCVQDPNRCPTPGVNILELRPVAGDECVQCGDEITLELWQKDLAQDVCGYQAFMGFDPTCLQIVSIVPTTTPYGLVAKNDFDNTAGTFDLIAGRLFNQPCTQADAKLATITLVAGVTDCIDTSVCFRVHGPPTRFTDPAGYPIYPCLEFAEIDIDCTDPVCEPPGPVTVACYDMVPTPDAAEVTCTDNNMDPPPVSTWIGDSDNGGAGCVGDPLIITRTYRCTDCSGNYSECTQTITVIDDVPPVITCPDDASFQCIEDVPPPNPSMATATDNCGDATITHVGDVSDGLTCPETITRTYRATDDCGNTADCDQIITVHDTTDPTITCPPPVTVQCREDVPPLDPNSVSASDNCGSVTVTHVGDVSDGLTCPETITRTYRATDLCGNYAECTQIITVHDTIDPLITCPPDVTVQCYGEMPPCDLSSVDATDNCGQVEITCDDVSDGYTCPETITRTYRATDLCGNYAECTQIITVHDTIDPVITCPADASVQCIEDVPAPDPNSAMATDNCGYVTVTFEGDVSDGLTCPETITRTYRATDSCGNYAECTQIITVHDTTDPVITCPDNISVQCIEDVPDPAIKSVTATDNCGYVTVTFEGDVSDGLTCPETITRTYRAADMCDNYVECTQIITVLDTIAPMITCPGPVTVECIEDVPPYDIALVTASDNCGYVTVTFEGDSSDGFTCPETITRTYRATDACGNWAECYQIITVDDTIDPMIYCPSAVSVQCSEDIPYPDPNSATASDNCGTVTVTFVGDVSDGLTCPETITRTYRATDPCGNWAECTQLITVHDTINPEITCPGDVAVQCDADVPQCDISSVVATDNCGVLEITCNDSSDGAVCPETITRTYRATDLCGNYAECTQIITVHDTIPPVITCPDDVMLECGASEDPSNTGCATATDNCDTDISITYADVRVDGLCEDEYTLLRTWTATDDCGNLAECVQTIMIKDTTPPTFDDCVETLMKVFPDPGDCCATVNVPQPTASDNCDTDVEITVYRSDGADVHDPYCPGETIVWWVAEDNCGNAAMCMRMIEVEDVNILRVIVEMPGFFMPISRCVHFEAWDCPGADPAWIFDEEVVFIPMPPSPGPYAHGMVDLYVPCDIHLTCMTAQDKLHTLRSTDELDIETYVDVDSTVRSRYIAEYLLTDFNALLPGNTDKCLQDQLPDEMDWWIDILDFGVIMSEWAQHYCGGLPVDQSNPPFNGHTPCLACDYYPHADIDGNGYVNQTDVSFWYVNLLENYMDNCCGAPYLLGGGGSAGRPTMSISVSELRERGMGRLGVADLNSDGLLDMGDYEAFMRGARPVAQSFDEIESNHATTPDQATPTEMETPQP